MQDWKQDEGGLGQGEFLAVKAVTFNEVSSRNLVFLDEATSQRLSSVRTDGSISIIA